MSARPDYYQMLRVSEQASGDEIRSSYRAIVRQLSSNPRAVDEYGPLPLVNEAFRTLGDPSHRADYDRQRKAAAQSAVSVPAAAPAAAPAPDAPRHVAADCPFCAAAIGASESDAPEASCRVCAAPLFPAQHHARRPESRREMERLPVHLRASFRRAGTPHEIVRGVSKDVSLTGMRLVTTAALQIGERISIDSDFCVAVGVVRHVSASAEGDGLWECGVQFLTLRVKHSRGGLISTVA